jgi:hypothetical protein
MTTYAAAIAARLQGREDEDMGKDENDAEKVDALVTEIDERLGQLVDMVSARNPDASHVELLVERERVAELEGKLADALYNAESFREQAENAGKAHRQALDRIEGLERSAGMAAAADADQEISELRTLLATAYVTHEVPWTDVAAGMMTIARDGTPWMVDQVCDNDDVELRNAGRSFMKTPAPGETVRVLVPYMTDEQAEGLVKSELGGREVETDER